MESSRDPDDEELGADVLHARRVDDAGWPARYFVVTPECVIHVMDSASEPEKSERTPMSEQPSRLPLVAGVSALGTIGWDAWKRHRERGAQKDDVLLRLLKMNDKEFEEAVGELFRRMDYRQVRVVGGPRDRGGDVLCWDRWDRLTIVQCKNWKKPVGPSEIRGLKGFFPEIRVHKRIMVTNSLTPDANEEARNADILCIDLDRLVDLITSPRPRL